MSSRRFWDSFRKQDHLKIEGYLLLTYIHTYIHVYLPPSHILICPSTHFLHNTNRTIYLFTQHCFHRQMRQGRPSVPHLLKCLYPKGKRGRRRERRKGVRKISGWADISLVFCPVEITYVATLCGTRTPLTTYEAYDSQYVG